MKNKYKSFLLIPLVLSACSTSENKRNTLRDIDISNNKQKQETIFIKPKSKDDIREAYANYIKYAAKDEGSRLDAINRLAELEFELSNKLQQENDNLKTDANQEIDDRLYNERLDKTVELLRTSLNDYPKAKGNDRILYQLAKAYDHKGDNNNSEKTLSILVKKYPKSKYYIEAQFRLAEILFSKRNYVKAEDTYTDIIGSSKNNIFYEKALFKRGWARFKQEYYLEAVDDYLEAVDYHNFDDYSELNQSQQEQFNEYFRAVGLSFSYLGGAEPLNQYFKNNPSFRYIYYSYSHVSDIYLKQQRFSDAANTLKLFIDNNKDSDKIPVAHLHIVKIWKDNGFAKKASDEIDFLYEKYNPISKYWLKKNINENTYKEVSAELKENVLLVASYYHKLYQENSKKDNFNNADKWYKRYLKHYKPHAQKDNIYYQYASLLSANKQLNNALNFYELAAYDGDIILNKKAAYATILLSNKIYESTKENSQKMVILNKHIRYATLYTQLYSTDKQSIEIILHAAEMAFITGQFNKAIELADSMPNATKSSNNTKATILKAHSYFKTNEYINAEAAYFSALSDGYVSDKTKHDIIDKLALSIYKQAEIANKEGKIKEAIEHFVRISTIAPSSPISATGFYDGIALSMKHELWDTSIQNIKMFQQKYPNHNFNNDVTKKLSVAYLKSNQNVKAAQEFEKISGLENNREVKIAALWQAAELYESKNELKSAIRSYEKYTNNYKKPFPQYMESMSKLTELYAKINNNHKVIHWNNEIIETDKKTINKLKTDRTRYITSLASLNLAKYEHEKFTKQQLIIPLKLSLRKKKYALQRAVKYYGQASKFGIAETATESTYAIADIYKSFSKDLLSSQRPKSLSGDELEQYIILLEDMAFPFEDKAIEFYEANMSHIKDGIYNKWVKQSHEQLKELFPARYKRSAKLDGYINVLH